MSKIIRFRRLKKLKCSLCEIYLSVFPIYTYDGKGICGRCNPPDGAVRCQPYEVLAEKQDFPCCYFKRGCIEEHHPAELAKHEENCVFRSKICLYNEDTKCEWQGPVFDFIDHSFERHPTKFIEENIWFSIETKVSEKNTRILISKYSCFLVTWLTIAEEKKVTFLINHYYKSPSSMESNFELLLTDTHNTHFANIKIGCQLSVIDSKMFESDTIECVITSDYREITTQNVMISLEKLLTCSNCEKLNYFSSFYQINHKAIYCQKCNDETVKKKVPSKILNDLSKSLISPCNFKEAGCNYRNYSSLMDQHLKWCEYMNTSCRFSQEENLCNFLCLQRDLEAHYQQCHNNYHNGQLISILSIELNEQYSYSDKRFMKFEKKCFPIEISIVNGTFLLNLKKLVPTEKQFKYEVSFWDGKHLSNRLILRETINDVDQDEYFCKVLLRDLSAFLNKKEGGLNLSFEITIYHASCVDFIM